jgi:Holliday junction resolvasome RuvABC ATP-dependent DNA helicase subunit
VYSLDKKILLTIMQKFDGGTGWPGNTSATVGEEAETLERRCRTFFYSKEEFLQRTPREER